MKQSEKIPEDESFRFYKNYAECVKRLPLEDQKDFCYAIVKYALYGVEPDFDEEKSPDLVDRWRLTRPYLTKSRNMARPGNQNAKKTQNAKRNAKRNSFLENEEREEEGEYEKDNPKRKPSNEGKRKGATFLHWTADDFKREAERAAAEHPEYRPYLELFVAYWTAEHRSGKLLFQVQETFSMLGRLATWKRNEGRFPPQSASEKSPSEMIDEVMAR